MQRSHIAIKSELLHSHSHLQSSLVVVVLRKELERDQFSSASELEVLLRSALLCHCSAITPELSHGTQATSRDTYRLIAVRPTVTTYTTVQSCQETSASKSTTTICTDRNDRNDRNDCAGRTGT